MLGLTRKAAGLVSLSRATVDCAWVCAWVCVEHCSLPRTTIAVSDYVTSALFSAFCFCFVYFIEQRNAGGEEGGGEESSLAELISIDWREEAAARRNNLFTAIMHCEFMPLPGGTTTNSHLKCDKNSANGLDSVSGLSLTEAEREEDAAAPHNARCRDALAPHRTKLGRGRAALRCRGW